MKYFEQRKTDETLEPKEITKEEAHNKLQGYWKKEMLEEIFKKEKQFRLWTPYVTIYTNKDGLIPQPGFFGVL